MHIQYTMATLYVYNNVIQEIDASNLIENVKSTQFEVCMYTVMCVFTIKQMFLCDKQE